MAGARFKEEGQIKLIPYQEVFRHTRQIGAENEGELVAYPNRDSVPFEALYGLNSATTFIRGTIRYKVFAERWRHFADAGVANSSILVEAGITFGQWAALFRWHPKAYDLLNALVKQAYWEKKPIEKTQTSAEALLALLMQCWNPGKGYKDRALMRHRILYEKEGEMMEYIGQLDFRGNSAHTAMAFLVGLPIAILIEEQIQSPIFGIVTPALPTVWPIIYNNLTRFGLNLAYQVVPLK
jgi:hypothetical protein